MNRTVDGGATWQEVPLPDPSVSTDGSRRELTAAGFESATAGWIQVNLAYLQTAYRTEDGGKTWQKQFESTISSHGQQVSAFFLAGGQVGWVGGFVSSNRPATPTMRPRCRPWSAGRQDFAVRLILLKTTDGGKHWTEQYLPGGEKHCQVDQLYFRNENQGVAVAGHQIYYTVDGGKQWRRSILDTAAEDPKWLEWEALLVTSIVFVNDRRGWISYEDGALFTTDDSGARWTLLKRPGRIWDMHFGMRNAAGSMCFLDERSGWIVGDDWAVYETDDGGKSWYDVEVPERILSVGGGAGQCGALSMEWFYRIVP